MSIIETEVERYETHWDTMKNAYRSSDDEISESSSSLISICAQNPNPTIPERDNHHGFGEESSEDDFCSKNSKPTRKRKGESREDDEDQSPENSSSSISFCASQRPKNSQPTRTGKGDKESVDTAIPTKKRIRAFPPSLEKYQYAGSTEFRTEADLKAVRRHIASVHFGGNDFNGLKLIKRSTTPSKIHPTRPTRWHCTHKNTGQCKWLCEEVQTNKEDGNFDFSFFRIGTVPHSGHDGTTSKRGLPKVAKTMLSSRDMKPNQLLHKCRTNGIELPWENWRKQTQWYIDSRRRSHRPKK